MEMSALVLGIVGLVLSILNSFLGLSWIGSICGLLAVIFGALGMKKEGADKVKAKTGFVLGIVAMALGIIFFATCMISVASSGALSKTSLNSYIFEWFENYFNSL